MWCQKRQPLRINIVLICQKTFKKCIHNTFWCWVMFTDFKENLRLNDLSLCMLKIDCDFFNEFLYSMTTCFLYFAILSTFLPSSIWWKSCLLATFDFLKIFQFFHLLVFNFFYFFTFFGSFQNIGFITKIIRSYSIIIVFWLVTVKQGKP